MGCKHIISGKKADYPIECCEECKHLTYSPIRDAICDKTSKYIWLNTSVLPFDDGGGKKPYKYIPKWCPLEGMKVCMII